MDRIGGTVCPFVDGACFADWDKLVVLEELVKGKTGAVFAKISKKEKKKLKKAKVQLPRNIEHDVSAAPLEEPQFIPEPATEVDTSNINGAFGMADL